MKKHWGRVGVVQIMKVDYLKIVDTWEGLGGEQLFQLFGGRKCKMKLKF